MLVLEIGRAFDRHPAADVRRRLLDLLRREAKAVAQDREVPIVESLVGASPSFSVQNSSPSTNLLNTNGSSNALGNAVSTREIASSSKPLALSVARLMCGASSSVPVPLA